MTDPSERPRILIVEDDPDHRHLLVDALTMHYGEDAAANIVAVATGRECLQRELAAFDVVLLDYHLPDVAGIALLEQVLAAADVPVVFVTGENDSAVAAEAIRGGAEDYVVKMGDYLFALPVLIEKSIGQHRTKRENEHLRRQLELMLEELRDKNAQLEASLGQVRRMATTDHLTGLANRRRFSEELERQFSDAVRYGHDLTCCMCDLDNYKQLNDTLGHQVGDEVLVTTARVVQSLLRLSDMAARYGGDEFVLLLPHAGCAEALAVGRRLREQLAAQMDGAHELCRVLTVSMGIASLHVDQPGTADELVAMADRAMYAAKAAGRDRIVLYSQAADAVRN